MSAVESPVWDVTLADQLVTEDVPFTLTRAASDFSHPAGQTLTVAATLGNGDSLPSWLDWNSNTLTLSSITGPLQPDVDTGAITVRFRVSDTSGGFADDDVLFTPVGVDDAPGVGAPLGNQSVKPDQTTMIYVPQGTILDEEGDPITYTALFGGGAALPEWASFDGTAFSFSPNSGDEGTYSVELTGTDTGAQSVTYTFILYVTNGTSILRSRLTGPPPLRLPVQKKIGYKIFDLEDAAMSTPLSSGIVDVTTADGTFDIAYGIAPGREYYVWVWALDKSFRDTVKMVTQLVP